MRSSRIRPFREQCHQGLVVGVMNGVATDQDGAAMAPPDKIVTAVAANQQVAPRLAVQVIAVASAE